MASWLLAVLVGLLAASGLFIGALVGYTGALSHRLIATVMGFAGVLVAVLTLELVAESGERGSSWSLCSSDPQLVEDSRARDPADGLPKK